MEQQDLLSGEANPQFNINTSNVTSSVQPDLQSVFHDLHTVLQQRHASPRAFALLEAAQNAVGQAQAQAQAQGQPTATTSSRAAIRRMEDMLQNAIGSISLLQHRLSSVEANNTVQQNTNMNTAPAASTNSQLSKLVQKKPPSKYDGHPAKLANWLFEVKQFLQLAGFDSENAKAKYVVSLLEGKALTWWRSFSQTASGDLDLLEFEDLEVNLKEQFEDVDRELKLRRKLKNLRQLQSVQSYVNEFRRVQLELGDHKLEDGAALFEFLEGLKDSVRQQVLLNRPVVLEDAIILAERADAAIMYSRSHNDGYRGRNNGYRGGYGGNNKNKHRNNGYNRSNNGYAPMDIDALEGSSKHTGGAGGARGSGGARGKITCYYCGKPGHVKRQCFKLQREQQGKQQQARVHAMELPPPPSVDDCAKN